MEAGTNSGNGGQTLAEIISKMAEILREGTNFGKNVFVKGGQTSAGVTNFGTEEKLLHKIFSKRGDKIWQKSDQK